MKYENITIFLLVSWAVCPKHGHENKPYFKIISLFSNLKFYTQTTFTNDVNFFIFHQILTGLAPIWRHFPFVILGSKK